MEIKLSVLFPTYSSVVIFVAYMIFCVGQGVFITASRQKGSKNYDYNIVAAVLLTEVLKLVIATLCYLKDHSPKSLLESVIREKRVCALYLIPSLLYCVYNNLSFVNLAAFDPTSYYILLQFRVVITGVVFQCIFKRKLTAGQWIALMLLTLGCIFQQLKWDDKYSLAGFRLPLINLSLLFVQVFCSCLAGVYNEYLLKNASGGSVNIFIQNIFMYVDSILWNILVLKGQGNLLADVSGHSFSSLLTPLVLLLILNNALIGITTSLFLKNLDSILKTFASALEIILTAILSFILFQIPVHFNTVVAIVIVAYAIFLYSSKAPLPVNYQKIESVV